MEIGADRDGRSITYDQTVHAFSISGMPTSVDRLVAYDHGGNVVWASDELREWVYEFHRTAREDAADVPQASTACESETSSRRGTATRGDTVSLDTFWIALVLSGVVILAFIVAWYASPGTSYVSGFRYMGHLVFVLLLAFLSTFALPRARRLVVMGVTVVLGFGMVWSLNAVSVPSMVSVIYVGPLLGCLLGLLGVFVYGLTTFLYRVVRRLTGVFRSHPSSPNSAITHAAAPPSTISGRAPQDLTPKHSALGRIAGLCAAGALFAGMGGTLINGQPPPRSIESASYGMWLVARRIVMPLWLISLVLITTAVVMAGVALSRSQRREFP